MGSAASQGMLAILLCFVHLFTAASPLAAYGGAGKSPRVHEPRGGAIGYCLFADYALAHCQRQRVSVSTERRSSTTTSRLDNQCGKKTVVEYERSSQPQLLEFSLLSRGRKCNETFRLFIGRAVRAQVSVR